MKAIDLMPMKRLDPPAMPSWLEAMVPYRRYSVDVGKRMHVMETGQGMPVLMLHGNPTWGFLYRKVVKALEGEPLRIIVPDLIGLGFSSKPSSAKAHTIENHARWLGRLIDDLELDGLIFVCQDWGGAIGAYTLSIRFKLLKGLVAMNTIFDPPRPGFRPTTFHRFGQMPIISNVAFRLMGFPQRMLHRVQGDPASIRGQVARAYRYPLRRLKDNVAPLALARMVPDSMEHPSIAALKYSQRVIQDFKGPAASVWGDRDPVLGRAIRRVSWMLPDAQVTRTQAGHFVQEEVPDLVAAAVRDVAGRIG